jgi:hypothetical protein
MLKTRAVIMLTQTILPHAMNAIAMGTTNIGLQGNTKSASTAITVTTMKDVMITAIANQLPAID